MNTKLFLGIIGIILVIGVIGGIVAGTKTGSSKPGQYDALAMHLTNTGAKFYGAFWCPHCQNQKKAFGNSAKLLPYQECSTPDGKSSLQICKDEKISAYPTWKFPFPLILKENLRTVCEVRDPQNPPADPLCENTASTYTKVWVFEKESVGSETEPVKNVDGSYTIAPFSRVVAEISPETLALWSGFQLNTETEATTTQK